MKGARYRERDHGRLRLNSFRFQCLKARHVAALEAIRKEAWRGQPNKDEPSTVLWFFDGEVAKGGGPSLQSGIDVSESKLSSCSGQSDLQAFDGLLSVL